MIRYKKYIKRGIWEPLKSVLFHDHGNVPVIRYLMVNKKIFPKAKIHIAAHIVKKLPKKIPEYALPHEHNCDEFNLILSERSKLVYKILLGKETYKVSSPASVFIPKGLTHSANVVSGRGIFICIVLKGNYKKSFN